MEKERKMNKLRVKKGTVVAVILASVLTLASFAAKAASQDRVLARINIPFAFSVEGQQFRAGDYELRQIGANIVGLENCATKHGVILPSRTPGSVASGDGRMIFHVYNTDHFLASVAAPAYETSLPKSDSEKQVEASVAAMRTVAVQVRY
jgi:hypothetical protein